MTDKGWLCTQSANGMWIATKGGRSLGPYHLADDLARAVNRAESRMGDPHGRPGEVAKPRQRSGEILK